MKYSTTKTSSGIVLCNAFSDKFKTNHIGISLFYPLTKENASKIALLCAVLKRGNNDFGEMDKVGAFLEKNYGATFNISTAKTGEMQELSFTAGFIDDKYAIDGEKVSQNIISLLYSTLFSPMTENGGFRESFVTQERLNLKNRIRALINDKQGYSFEKCKQTMFANENYGVYEQGDEAELDKITPQSLYSFYLELLSSAMLFVCYAGAECDTEQLFKPLMQKLEDKERIAFSTVIDNSVTSVKDISEQMNVAQSKLNLGFRLGDTAKADLFALKMFNVIFGSSPTSKLFMNVRERLSLCYYCSSLCDSVKNVMFVYSGVETENVPVARDEILNQLSLMKKGEFSDEEFQNAKAYLIDSYVQAGDMPAALISFLISAVIHGHMLTPEQQIEEIKKVTPERVVAVAQNVTLDTVYLLKGMGGAANDN